MDRRSLLRAITTKGGQGLNDLYSVDYCDKMVNEITIMLDKLPVSAAKWILNKTIEQLDYTSIVNSLSISNHSDT